MSAVAALTAALVASLWQVTLVALGFALARLVVTRPAHRVWLALATLAAQVAWPVLTFLGTEAQSARVLNPGVSHGRWWLLVPVAWAVGAVVMSLRLLGGFLEVQRWKRVAEPLSEALTARFEALRARLGVRAVRLAGLAQLDSPLTVGFWKPVVLVPLSALTAVPIDSLELLLAHELVHVRRFDALFNSLQLVAEALLFFHPALWWVSACAREEREYACDEVVVRELGVRRKYAEALLALESCRQPAPALAVASTGGAFMQRIRRVVGLGSGRSGWLAALVLVIVGGASAAVAWTLQSRDAGLVVPISDELRPALAGMCRHFHDDPCRPEIVAANVDPADLATIAFGDFGEKTPGFEAFMVALVDVPPTERHDTIVRSVSAALGSKWECPEFDTLWNSQPVTWCSR
ncbi:MAG: M56 family metallopeptidase [Myxococcaceae bacterium]